MKVYPRIDYNQRPSSYWNDETLEQAILKNIKGDFRREEIRKALAAGNMEAIPEEILKEALSENVRSFTSRQEMRRAERLRSAHGRCRSGAKRSRNRHILIFSGNTGIRMEKCSAKSAKQ